MRSVVDRNVIMRRTIHQYSEEVWPGTNSESPLHRNISSGFRYRSWVYPYYGDVRSQTVPHRYGVVLKVPVCQDSAVISGHVLTLPALELKTHTHDWRSQTSNGGGLQFSTLPKKLHRSCTKFQSPSLRRRPHSGLSAAVRVSGGPFFWRNYVQCLRVPHRHHRLVWAEFRQPCNNLLDTLTVAVTPCSF